MAETVIEPELQQLTEQLRAYVTPEARHVNVDETFVLACAAQARSLVDQLAGTVTVADPATGVITRTLTVPAEIRERAIIEAGSELFHKRQAPNGISQFADAAGTPLRVAKDPMNVARVILQPFLQLGFA